MAAPDKPPVRPFSRARSRRDGLGGRSLVTVSRDRHAAVPRFWAGAFDEFHRAAGIVAVDKFQEG